MNEQEPPLESRKVGPYRRENRHNPTVFPAPVKAVKPPLTPEEVDDRLGVLDRIGTRIIRHHHSRCITTPIVPTERMMEALADLEMDLSILLIKQEKPGGILDLYYTVLEKGWLAIWKESGWKGVEKLVRWNVSLMDLIY